MKLFSWLTENAALKIVAFGIAFLLWVIILRSQKVEIEKEIPIRVTTAENVMLGNDVPKKVTFRLLGPKGFLQQILEKNVRPIEVNLKASQPGLITYRFFPNDISGLPANVEVTSINPATLFVRLEEAQSRELPVKPELLGTLPDGYRIKRIAVEPPLVRIRGPQSRIDRIKEIHLKPLDVSELTSRFEGAVEIDAERAKVELEGDTPRLIVEVEEVESTFKIRNVPVTVRSQHQFSISDPKAILFVRATAGSLQGWDQTKLSIELDLKARKKGRYQEKLRPELPAGVKLVRTVPERVTVTLY